MVSETDLVDRLRQVLRNSDLSTTTAVAVRRSLDEEFGVDLSDRKAFIRQQIETFVESRNDEGAENEGVDEKAEGEIDAEDVAENVAPDDDDRIGSEEDDAEVEETGGKRSKQERPDKVDNGVKKKRGAFTKPWELSPQLQTFLGVSELARPEVVKRTWAYIREKNLQDPKNRQKILCDEALHKIFRVNSINMFQMNKALSKHIWPLNEEEVPARSLQKKKQHNQDREGENVLPRADVVTRMWECMKQNVLQVTQEWPGLPRGLKFDPSDQEIIWHLLAKVGVGNMKPHPFIDEFIPTVNEDDGICYTHPQYLPGVRQDGNVSYFFHRAIKAYNTGSRKRRKILGDDFGDTRWHKTGRTKPVFLDGVQQGCKKIMVLYVSPVKGEKSQKKTNWVMHQYHLGTGGEEKAGDFLISKVFYQQQQVIQTDKLGPHLPEGTDVMIAKVDPATPRCGTPGPPRAER